MTEARSTLVSEAEFLALPESNQRIELLDGEVVLSPSPSVWHQELLTRIVHWLREWASGCEEAPFVGQSPLDVRFAPGRILQPDAFLIMAGIDLSADGPIDHVPDVCIEVLSRDRVYDRLTKRLVYAGAGVREYWTVEPVEVVERWFGDGLGQSERVTERLESPLLPGFELELAQLFSRS